MKFPKEFERYYAYVETPVLPEIPWVNRRIKQLVFNGWMAGRRYEKRQRR